MQGQLTTLIPFDSGSEAKEVFPTCFKSRILIFMNSDPSRGKQAEIECLHASGI